MKHRTAAAVKTRKSCAAFLLNFSHYSRIFGLNELHTEK